MSGLSPVIDTGMSGLVDTGTALAIPEGRMRANYKTKEEKYKCPHCPKVSKVEKDRINCYLLFENKKCILQSFLPDWCKLPNYYKFLDVVIVAITGTSFWTRF